MSEVKENKGPNIFQKINNVIKEMQPVSKDKSNLHQNYKYLSCDELLRIVNPLFAKHGINMYPVMAPPNITDLIDKKTGNISGKLTTMQCQYKFVNIDNPEDYFVSATIGQGSDSGDKGAYKASTGALKYCLFQTLLIATDDDPENEKSVNVSKSATKSTSSDF